MRNFLLFFILATTLVANDKYAIQVLSVKNKASISEDFMRKVNKVSMPSRGMKGESGYYKVFYGGIKTYKSAALILPYIQANVSRDAFILKENKVVSTAHRESSESTSTKPKIEKVTIAGPQDKLIKAKEKWRFQKLKINKAQVAKNPTPTKTQAAMARSKTAGTKVAKSKQVALEPKAKVKKATVQKVEILEPQDMPMQANQSMMDEMDIALCKKVKKSKRQKEIAEAVAFYASSSYYTFNK